MDYKSLKEKYEKKINILNYEIDIYKNSRNAEMQIAVSTLEKEKEETELILEAVKRMIE